ncbi:ATPase/histidine kinase/DNA gyrase B/HSP90 domain protein [Corynebacterium efficiens YS-314]|uniref:Sensor-like histidine kinase SenX3 n=1 Tax=Corynebacterium efficiens (strain DSM 44549 / YS-314 / AJ 12310 / JCM 11189 / NBRC 100395) TaxID=196164 RepID=Q8FSG9_COREF|nr:ATP-binding protein [Corynebacterium efficiens]EEW48441.1 ATPase/histidine kinase/DNA gyrase B/HSP90 domain protein [Corynebacterium efficiens YS-314]BAC17234.1 putative sensor kinase [Corynebacterium efficiens YS-314]
MSTFFAFLLGVVVAGLALPAYGWAKERFRRHKSATTLAENQVTTVGQVLHLAIQGSPTGITVVDRTGDVILSNGRAHSLGIVHQRTVNSDVWRVAQEAFDDKDTHTLDVNPSVNPRRPGNRVTAVRAVVKPLTLIDDRFVIIYATDESENVRMESARRDFVANVSHELKTPVGGMALLAEALMEAVDDPEQVEYFGARLHREAHRMADMINELISLSKLQGAERLPDMEPVKVDDIIDEAIERTQLAADNAQIELVRGDRTDVWVNAERSLLVTALANLISNAINYSPQSMPVSVSQNVCNDVVMIRVTDRGIGIAPEDQGRVFERFFRVDKARSRQTGGTGLGLAIVKHVMANHGGNISLWSRPGTGSTFTLELPVYHPESEAPAETPKRVGLDSTLRSTASKVTGRRKEKT